MIFDNGVALFKCCGDELLVFVGGVFRESTVVDICNEVVYFYVVVCDVYDDGGSAFVCFCDNGVVLCKFCL